MWLSLHRAQEHPPQQGVTKPQMPAVLRMRNMVYSHNQQSLSTYCVPGTAQHFIYVSFFNPQANLLNLVFLFPFLRWSKWGWRHLKVLLQVTCPRGNSGLSGLTSETASFFFWILPLLWNSLPLTEFISLGLWTSHLGLGYPPLGSLSPFPPLYAHSSPLPHTKPKLQFCSLYSKPCLLFYLTY